MPAITSPQKRLNQLTFEIAKAQKLRDEYVKNNSSKRYYWIKRVKSLENEQRTLQGKSTQGASGQQGNQGAVGQPVNREQIKAQIVQANNAAKAEDTKMRAALKNKDNVNANLHRQKRDQYNTEMKRLQALLNGKTQVTSAQNTGSQQGNQGAVGQPVNREQIKAQIVQANNAAKAEDTKMRAALKNKDNVNSNLHRRKRDQHNTEVKRLQALLNSKPQVTPAQNTGSQQGNQGAVGQPVNREQIKAQIVKANNAAKKADTQMRTALKSQHHTDANKYRQQRDQHNNEVKRLQALLNGSTATTQPASQQIQSVKPLSDAELTEYIRLKSNMDWWESKNQTKNIKKNEARFNELKYRYEKTKSVTQGATGVQGAAGPKGQAGVKGAAGNEDIVIKARNAYLKNTDLPDNGHNPILVHLLLNDFSKEKVNSMGLDKATVEAYQVLRLNPVMKARAEKIKDPKKRQATLDRYYHGATGAPQVVAGMRLPVSQLTGTNFFIRDYLQVHGSGGSNDAPWQVSGLTINDGAQKSMFQERFDDIVEEINKGIPEGKKPLGLFSAIAHRDAIQLIPVEYRNDKTTNFKNYRIDQKLGATMRYIEVNSNIITSTGKLQGIFATDGIFQDLSIVNNTITTQGSHYITINGMLSGTIDGNKGTNGLLPEGEIKLYPVRVGGELNIYIMGFSNKKGDTNNYAYKKPIKGKQKITDLRGVHPSTTGATFWKNVHIPTLQSTPASLLNKTLANYRQVRDKFIAELKAAEGNYSKRNAIKTAYQAKFENIVSEMMKRAGGIIDK